MFKDSLKHFIINASLIFPLSFEAARKEHHLSKICHTYSTLMKLGRVIPLEFLKVVLVNMVELLLMSAGLATLVFLKIKVF